jgi:hypothetical protein
MLKKEMLKYLLTSSTSPWETSFDVLKEACQGGHTPLIIEIPRSHRKGFISALGGEQHDIIYLLTWRLLAKTCSP